MNLAFDSARADGSPADEIGVVLAESGIEKFRCRGQACPRDRQQDLPGEMQPLVDWKNRIDFILTRTFDGFKHPSTKFAYVYFIATAKAIEDRLDYYKKNSEEEE